MSVKTNIKGKILLLGGGGHCLSVLDSLLASGVSAEDIGIIDNSKHLSVPCGVAIAGNDDDLDRLHRMGYKYAFVTVGSLGSTAVRRKLFSMLVSIGYELPNIIDPTAVVGRCVTLGRGIFVGKHAVINFGAAVGDCAIVNTSSVIEHGCRVGEFAHIAPSSTLCGDVTVGNDTHIGADAAVKQGVTIGSNTLIGLGSVVLKDIGDNRIAYGNPCKEVGDK